MAVTKYDSLSPALHLQPLLHLEKSPVDGCDWMWQSLPDIPLATMLHLDNLPLMDVTECDSLYQPPLKQTLFHPDNLLLNTTVFTWCPSGNPCSIQIISCWWFWLSVTGFTWHPSDNPCSTQIISYWWFWLSVTVFTWHPTCNPCFTRCDPQLMTECDSLYLTSLWQPLLHPMWSPVDGCDSLYQTPLWQPLLNLVWSSVDGCDWNGTVFA